MKGVITAAGLGRRSGLDGKMRKEMLPVYDLRGGKLVLRPIIDVIISGLHGHGIEEVAVVLDPSDRWTREYINSEFPEVEVLFQEEKRGFGHAVLMARDFVGSHDFVLNAGDGLILNRDAMKALTSAKSGIHLVLMRVDDPRRYGTAAISDEIGVIKVNGVVEKSENPPSHLALCAVYRLPGKIFSRLDGDGSANVELTPAIDSLIRAGEPAVATIIERKKWVSVGKAESYVDVLKETLSACSKPI